MASAIVQGAVIMPMRFKITSVAFAMMLLLTYNQVFRPFDSVLDVFLGLACLLILAAVTLWPNPSRVDRVDRAMAHSAWADRIKFEQQAADRAEAP
jgi:hypothetical protein